VIIISERIANFVIILISMREANGMVACPIVLCVSGRRTRERADGTILPRRLPDAANPAASPRKNDADDRDHRRRRDNDRRDRDGDRRDQGGRGGRGGRGQIHFARDTGTPCLTSSITHLTCNCGGADISSTYRQCLVSMRNSTVYFTALTLFDTGAYTSFVNKDVAKWLEQQ
jgi:hypothetical protein